MRQVSTQTELQSALNDSVAQIEVVANFEVNSQININYSVTISSVTGNVFTISKANSYFAYMFRVNTGGILNLTNIIIDGNKENHPIDTVSNRSLISVNGGRVNLSEGTILQNNNAYIEGGAIYLSGSPSYFNNLEMTGNAIIRNCYSKTNGGAIMVALRNSNDNVEIGGNSVIENNEANYGAGIYIRSYVVGIGSYINIKDSVQIKNNIATSNGGGIFVTNIVANTVPINLHISQNCNISNNSATNGGGIYFGSTNQNDSITINNQVNISNNTATNRGGGIFTSSLLNSFDGTNISDNKGGTGGGLYILTSAGGTLEMQNCQVLRNFSNNGLSGSGGGVWINNVGTNPYSFQATNTAFENNEATALGGGVYIIDQGTNSIININACDIKNNKADTNGAGILISAGTDSSTNFTDCNILENSSNNYGGGLYITNGVSGTANFTINNSNISSNYAEVQGGGLRMSSGEGIINTMVIDSIINNNTANTSSGGGIWSGGTHTDLTLQGTTTVSNNETNAGNGGGIYFNSEEGNLVLQDTKVLNNRANRVLSITGNNGGGICLVPGLATIQGNTEISGNIALRQGGGISTGENTNLRLISGMIQNNSATLGGGVFNKNSSFYFEGGEIINNNATIGGGIYNGN